jgi:hypothetical protein
MYRAASKFCDAYYECGFYLIGVKCFLLSRELLARGPNSFGLNFVEADY